MSLFDNLCIATECNFFELFSLIPFLSLETEQGLIDGDLGCT